MENNINPAGASSSATRAADRKTIERNRRNQMKELYSQLCSLLPPRQTTREPMSLPDQLDEAAKYIKKLQTNVVRMKERKDSLVARNSGRVHRRNGGGGNRRLPRVEVRVFGSALEVVLVTGSDSSPSVFNEMIRVIEEEGGEVVNASFSVAEDLVFHTIHSKIEDGNGAGCGANVGRISARLKKFMEEYECDM